MPPLSLLLGYRSSRCPNFLLRNSISHPSNQKSIASSSHCFSDPTDTHRPLCDKRGPIDTNTQVGSYTGSSETELLSTLKEHLPSVGSPTTSPSSSRGDNGTIGAGSSGGGIGDDEATGGGQQNLGGAKEEKSREIAGPVSLEAAKALIEAFDENVDVGRLLRDIRGHAIAQSARRSTSSAEDPLRQPPAAPPSLPLPPPTASPPSAVTPASVGDSTETARRGGGGEGGGGGGNDVGSSPPRGNAAAVTETSASSTRRTREEVEAEAAKQGASGG